MRNAWNELHVGAAQLGFRSSNSTIGQLYTKCQRMLRWSRGSARHTGSLGSVSTPTRERLFWRSFRLRWLSLVWKGWEDSRAGWRVFSRGKLTVGVGSSSGFLYWNMMCVVPCSVRPSLCTLGSQGYQIRFWSSVNFDNKFLFSFSHSLLTKMPF